MRPLIGITSYTERTSFGVWDVPAAVLPKTYVDSVMRAGGVPVLLPPLDNGQAELVRAVHGVILAGGADIGPANYHAPIHPQTIGTRPDRDNFELRLARTALAVGMPILGVCRGLQVLNTLLGGTLHQHLPDVVNNATHRPELGVFGTNQVRITPGSRVSQILGTSVNARCHHHQAIDRVARSLTVVGTAHDGTIEAVEVPGEQFVVGVQWHPEETATDDRLFTALVRAARAFAHLPAGEGPTDQMSRKASA